MDPHELANSSPVRDKRGLTTQERFQPKIGDNGEPRTPSKELLPTLTDEDLDDGTSYIDEDELLTLPAAQEAEILVAWIKDFDYFVKFPKFYGVLVHVLKNLVNGCSSGLPMNYSRPVRDRKRTHKENPADLLACSGLMA
jgi:hypothetical protein